MLSGREIIERDYFLSLGQKALDQMNLHLHHVISDVTGVTGLAILDAILAGERNPDVLAQLRDRVAKVDRLDAAAVETIIRTMASELRIESREIIHPARLALTGKTAGPGLFELTALLGRDRVVQRLDSAVEWIRRLPDSRGV